MKRKMIKAISLGLAAVCTAVTLTVSGGASGAENKPISGTDTLYTIGSVSKVYVTAAALQLADRGELDIDEPVTTYIPEFEMADPRYTDITVRMLMNHSSGLMGTTDNNQMVLDDNTTDWEEEFLELLKKQRLKADPGDFSVYCNDGFNLLQIVVERVSGMDFTDYITKNINEPLGLIQTGSCKNAFRSPYQVGIYDSHGNPFAVDYEQGIGAGGVLSTAAEVSRFGSAFFTGNTVLLSEKAKEQMMTSASDDKYEGTYGLGWDEVEAYPETGIKLLSKGGDLLNQHAELLVAPDEKISIGVCTSGGSSAIDTVFAKCLLDVVLEERGISTKAPEKPEYTLTDKIPESFRKYEGAYCLSASIAVVTFPDMKYMMVEEYTSSGTKTSYYSYSQEGVFVHMLGNVPKGEGVRDNDGDTLSFKERGGRTYIVADEMISYPEIGSVAFPNYVAEKMDPNPVSESVHNAWKARQGRYFFNSGKYSSMVYAQVPCVEFIIDDNFYGYASAWGVMKMVDENHLKAFTNIPNTASRDQNDITVKGDLAIIDGTTYTFIHEDAIPDFDPEMTEVSFNKRETKWFRATKDTANNLMSFRNTEKSSVYVYDKHGNIIFSTYMTGFDRGVPIPEGSFIAFIGEAGENVSISKVK